MFARRRWTAATLAWFVGCHTAAALPPRAVELNRQGALALAEGDLVAAEARLSLALEYSPEFTEAWVNHGLLALRRGDAQLARHDLLRARRLNADLPTPHHAIGLMEESLGRPRKAQARYEDALKVDPGFVPARANLARLLFAAGRFEEARSQFTRLVEIAPGEVQGWVGLAEALIRLGRAGDADLVTAGARQRLGDRPELIVLVARQLLRRGACAEAEAMLEPLTDVNDRSRRAEAWAWVGIARLASGQTEAAVKAAETALELDPSTEVARYVVAGALPSAQQEERGRRK